LAFSSNIPYIQMENHLRLEDVQPDPKAKRITLGVKKPTAAVTPTKTLTVANDDDDDFELSPKRRKLGRNYFLSLSYFILLY